MDRSVCSLVRRHWTNKHMFSSLDVITSFTSHYSAWSDKSKTYLICQSNVALLLLGVWRRSRLTRRQISLTHWHHHESSPWLDQTNQLASISTAVAVVIRMIPKKDDCCWLFAFDQRLEQAAQFQGRNNKCSSREREKKRESKREI